MIGFIDFWKQDRGWGIVKTPGSEQKYFLHITTVLSGRAMTGAHLKFEVGRNAKGLVAINAHILSAEEAAALMPPAAAGFASVAVQEGERGGGQ